MSCSFDNNILTINDPCGGVCPQNKTIVIKEFFNVYGVHRLSNQTGVKCYSK